MKQTAPDFLSRALDRRKRGNALRSLRTSNGLVDFCSNDYLGFARSDKLRKRIQQEIAWRPELFVGSTGSRLISGHSKMCEAVEAQIARFHGAESGLIFNSGYDANLGVFSSIPQRGDTILYDELAHASIRDGIRLSHANSYRFRHNDLEDLRRKARRAAGNIFVAVESVYSMDGDVAPLAELVALSRESGAHVVVDEAHATGVMGPMGKGVVADLNLQADFFARMHTFGKAAGCHGAIVLGSELLRNYLINFARSFIYTTFLPPHSLIAIKCAYDILGASEDDVLSLRRLIAEYHAGLDATLRAQSICNESAIQCIIVPGNLQVRKLAEHLQGRGFDVRPILAPTVPAGQERIRICLHAFNRRQDVRQVLRIVRDYLGAENDRG